MQINFATTNKMKFEIAQTYFAKLEGKHELIQYDMETPEIQDSSVEEIARQSAIWAAVKSGVPSIKMDVGFSIAALNGFPGPFVKYVNDWLTQDDFLKLLDGSQDRTAFFEDATAIGYPDGRSQVFTVKHMGKVGTIKNSSNNKWPANLLFIPEGYEVALGSLSNEQQNAYWGDGNWPAIIKYLEKSS